MDVQMPVYLYDVTTTGAPPRLVVTCKNSGDAHRLAAQLRDMRAQGQLAGVDDFTAAEPRVTSVAMHVDPGSSVVVRGYDVASDIVAAALAAAPPSGTP